MGPGYVFNGWVFLPSSPLVDDDRRDPRGDGIANYEDELKPG